MFYALCLVCAVRGLSLHLAHHREAKGRSAALATAAVAATPARDEVAVPVPAASAGQGVDAV
jgi:hypothetical protein